MPCQSSCNDKSLLRLSIVAAFFLQYDSLKKLVVPVLEEENVVAVGGTVRPSNDVELHDGKVVKYRLPKNILACMQLL